jgi:RimJ/RimL family protein N-acetyltransferase
MERKVLPDVVKQPSECSEEELESFHRLVLKGDQVENSGLKERIRRNGALLAFHYENGVIIGVTGLKKPNKAHKEKIFGQAAVSEEADNYDLEIGWAFVEKEYRGKGVCPHLIQEIFDSSKSQNFFATAREDNTSVHRVLEKRGFKKIGRPYAGRDNRRCQLFVKSPMPDHELIRGKLRISRACLSAR